MNLFTLRGKLPSSTRTALELGGIGLLLLIWFAITAGEKPLVNTGIIPPPADVLRATGSMMSENELIKNTCRSLGLNLAGYIEAIVIGLLAGFIIGLFPLFRGLFQRQVDAIRYVPLTAATGLFIIWFGLGTTMKTHFLAFGILIYLLPMVVQRIDEVQDVYLKTVYTLGANNWQTILTVYIPSVMSRLSDDIRVLTAISWTYIIIAENFTNDGGIGGMIWRLGQRQSRIDIVFALLLIIILIGVVQDKLFIYLDRELFPHKYQTKNAYEKASAKKSRLLEDALNFAFNAFIWMLLIGYLLLLLDELFGLFTGTGVLSYLFGNTQWAVHVLFGVILLYKAGKLLKKGLPNPKRQDTPAEKK